MKKSAVSEDCCLLRSPLAWLYLLAPFIEGGYREWQGCLFAALLAVYLIAAACRNGGLMLPKSAAAGAAAVMVTFLGLSGFWAVDRGMALVGMAKFLPLPLFALALYQEPEPVRKGLLSLTPVVGCSMTLLSILGGFVPSWHEFFYVSSRLSGFFRYPNTFAVYLLAGLAILLPEQRPLRKKLPCLAILLAGIILSGSRIVMALTVAALIALCLLQRGRKIKLITAGGAAAAILLAAAYVLLSGDSAAVRHYLASSFSSSSFVSRLQYWKDALPVIARHPFGLGYMGYYFSQGSFQTAVYAVMDAHNELIQLLLDAGWIPAACCIAAAVICLHKAEWKSRLVMAVIILHSLADFDLQYISIGFLLLLAMEQSQSEAVRIEKKGLTACISGLLVCFSVWMGTASAACTFKAYETAVSLYPGYTLAWQQLLQQAETADEMAAIADRILSVNESATLAWTAKAKKAYSDGDFGTMISCKQRAIACNPYSIDEYTDYLDMLCIGYQLYTQAGDNSSAEYCLDQIREVPNLLAAVAEKTSPLAGYMSHKPSLDLPEEYQQLLDSLS